MLKKEFSCFIALRCCVNRAYRCWNVNIYFEQDKFWLRWFEQEWLDWDIVGEKTKTHIPWSLISTITANSPILIAFAICLFLLLSPLFPDFGGPRLSFCTPLCLTSFESSTEFSTELPFCVASPFLALSSLTVTKNLRSSETVSGCCFFAESLAWTLDPFGFLGVFGALGVLFDLRTVATGVPVALVCDTTSCLVLQDPIISGSSDKSTSLAK